MRITGWKLVIYCEDEKTGIETVENVVDIPNWVANRVDEFLYEVEENPEILSLDGTEEK
jgi:hypothetical protein